ncbi:MAG: hypothetical protein ACYDIA_07280 [Candidatus Humimicrobiaceae bacterium]
MASFYWYERDPVLFEGEKMAMKKYFPAFRLEKLEDGQLCWIGQLNPRGSAGGIWTIQVLYENNHPSNDTYGGSIRVYSIRPNLNDLYSATEKLPHVLKDSNDELYICTARKEDFKTGSKVTTSAASALGWASTWIFVVEEWLDGKIGDEIFLHTY